MPRCGNLILRCQPNYSTCLECGILLRGESARRMHFKLKHLKTIGERVTVDIFNCPCGKGFSYKKDLLKHKSICKILSMTNK